MVHLLHTHVDLAALAAETPPDGILSRAVYQDEQVKAVWFGFAQGQELSEHTASVPAILHVLAGEAKLTLGAHTMEAGPGTWVHMPARLSHAIVARTQLSLLLLMLRGGAPRE
jgi:quercetin dioxygenase-like cupin family protein